MDVIQLSLTFLAGGGLTAFVFAAVGGAYFKKRGEALATKHDFADLVEQLRTTTAAAEEVRLALSNADWTAREWKNTRRVKLEEMLVAASSAMKDLLALERDVLDVHRRGEVVVKSGYDVVRTIGQIYFPELAAVVHDFDHSMDAFVVECLGVADAIENAATDEEKRVARDSRQAALRERRGRAHRAMLGMQGEAVELVQRDFGVRSVADLAAADALVRSRFKGWIEKDKADAGDEPKNPAGTPDS
jgi:hypothetical protein